MCTLSRAIGLELERLAMHLATLNGLATDIAYLQAAATYGRLRTAIINATSVSAATALAVAGFAPVRQRDSTMPCARPAQHPARVPADFSAGQCT
jgi:hypothetical protein